MAYIYPFRMTSTTATLLLIDPIAEEVVGGIRSNTAWVYPDTNSLCGGFMEARFDKSQADNPAMVEARQIADELLGFDYKADEYHEGEDAQTCMIREAFEEMGIVLERHQLFLFDTRTNSRTDTRAHVTNVCFYALLTPEQSALVPHGRDVSDLDDLREITRIKIADLFSDTPNIEQHYPMAFNHFEIMIQGLIAWKKEKEYQELKNEVQLLRDRVALLEHRNSDAAWDRAGLEGRQGGA